MTQEARKAINAYLREWRKRNPQKVKEYQRKYWERKAERLKKQDKDA